MKWSPSSLTRSARLFGGFCFTLAVGATSAAGASPVFETYGAVLGRGGYNARASAADAASTYFNPALLPKARRGLDVALFTAHDSISIDLQKRSRENDLAELGRGKYEGGDARAIPTRWLEQGCDPGRGGSCTSELPARPRQAAGSSQRTRPYAAVGLVTPIFGEHLVAGLYAMVPLQVFTRAHSFFVDEREQYFSNSLHAELYSDRLDAISFALGLGGQLTRSLALGLSLSLSMGNRADVSTYVSDSTRIGETLQLSNAVDVDGRLSPHGGLKYAPSEALSLSATVHSPQKFEIRTRTRSLLPLGDLQVADRRTVHDWLPWRVALGADYRFLRGARHELAAVCNLTFARWSRYLNRQGERPRLDFEWRDTLSGSLGLRHVHRGRLRSLLDLTYVPSPVPQQVGRENYVDSDRAGVVLGSEYEFPARGRLTYRLGFNAQLHVLRRRSHRKLDPSKLPPVYPQLVVDEWADDQVDASTGEVYAQAAGLQTNNPGWPGFGSQGFLLGAGLSFSVLY